MPGRQDCTVVIGDRFSRMRAEYFDNGAARGNLRYGYVRRPERWTG